MTGAWRRILVIEDDPETAGQLVDFLGSHGYQADLAANGEDGLQLGLSGRYAVMTIDRMLPGIDGLTIIRRLREAGIVTPALIISALGEVDDRVRGLRGGGDDYLVKPFAFAELLARVEALARRSTTVVRETVLRVGDLELDLVSRKANRGGKAICVVEGVAAGIFRDLVHDQLFGEEFIHEIPVSGHEYGRQGVVPVVGRTEHRIDRQAANGIIAARQRQDPGTVF